MVAGENSKTAGIIWDRFVKSKLGREIRDRSFNRRAGAGFSISILTREIISERVVDLLQFPKKRFVLGKFFKPRLPGELEHAHRIMMGPVPPIGIEVAEKPAGRRLPRPPEIECDFPKRFQGRGKGGDYIINLKRRHERRRTEKLAKNS